MSGIAAHHAEWLNLIERSGPFFEPPVLVRVFPQGLPKVSTAKLGRLRAAYEEWAEAQESHSHDADTLHTTWITLVLSELLEFDEQVLRDGGGLPTGLEVPLAEHHETLRPSMAVVEPSGRPKAGTARLLIEWWPLAQDLESAIPSSRWAASPLERMTQLCRSARPDGVRLGLVTNGERWTLVDAPVGQTVGYGSWYSGLWLQEPITLAAFEGLLGVRRFFGVAEIDTPEAMLDESVAYQQEVTDQLGYQVRRAVEVLIQALDRADFDRQRELLRDVPPERLYQAALTVMMRLVFLFCAEERGLLLLGDPIYDANYAVSSLRAQLREEADRVGLEVLERRQDAWARLLATFRAVYGGIEHEVLRLPALGGSLFDPDRFPFLEGRALGSIWTETAALPLPIDNRTVLHLLDSLQLLRMRGDSGASEARKLSYRALDIEQIGHVYEGLLDHVAVRVETDTLGLTGSKDKEREISLNELERERRRGTEALVEFLKEQTGRSSSGLQNALDAAINEAAEQKLLVACGNDKSLLKRALPFHELIRNDVWNFPQVYRTGSFMVTGGSERRHTGTHYTPKSLTEKIVTETLEPLVYAGRSEGKPREEWKLRPPVELLDLKICDMAMGSAAFLVQVCRWLGERLVEAWDEADRSGKSVSADGEVLERVAGHDLLAKDRQERLSVAYRLIAERCVYGVDINPMAVELAKLSLWLVTLAKGRPFGFLDHNLRCGDSLLGVTSLDQLENFHLDPHRGKELHRTLFDPRHHIRAAVAEALELRRRLRAVRIRDIDDVKAMARLDSHAKRAIEQSELIGDLLMGVAIVNKDINSSAFEQQVVKTADQIARWLNGETKEEPQLRHQAREMLDVGCPEHLRPRQCFHWALEFPEVFQGKREGFDAIVSNPPFMGGRLVGRRLGEEYQEYLKIIRNGVRGSPDLCAYFILRAHRLLAASGYMGVLATKSISETGSRAVALDQVIGAGGRIFRANSRMPWPGSAAVVVSVLWITRGPWGAKFILDDREVGAIDGGLEEVVFVDRPKKLRELKGKYSQGQTIAGSGGFDLTANERNALLHEDPRCEDVVLPLFNGQDLNTLGALRPYRWVIYFRDWPEDVARSYGAAFRRLEQLVKPYRDSLTGQIHQTSFWKFWDLRPTLMKEFSEHDWVLASARVTKYVTFRRVPTTNIYNEKTKIYFLYEWAHFAILQSSFHQEWAFWLCATLGATTLNYSTSAALETWPMPSLTAGSSWRRLNEIGKEYHDLREAIMNERDEGLTQIYNRYHDRNDRSEDIAKLRCLHVELDHAVANTYGWTQLQLHHEFMETSFGPRYTISSATRHDAFQIILTVNHGRFAEEKNRSVTAIKRDRMEPLG